MGEASLGFQLPHSPLPSPPQHRPRTGPPIHSTRPFGAPARGLVCMRRSSAHPSFASAGLLGARLCVHKGSPSGRARWPLHLATTLGKFLLTLICQKLRKWLQQLPRIRSVRGKQALSLPSSSCPHRETPQEGGDPRTLLPKALGNIC